MAIRMVDTAADSVKVPSHSSFESRFATLQPAPVQYRQWLKSDVRRPQHWQRHRCLAAAARFDSRHESTPAEQQEVLALKEWAVTCAALANGDQTVLLRKGGIDEPRFLPRASRFFLFPTSFHSDVPLVKVSAAERYSQSLATAPKEQQQLELGVVAELAGAWTTADAEVVQALDAFHVWTPDYLQKRLRWRKRQPITVMELRCRRLRQPLSVTNSPELWGCFSWVPLPLPPSSVCAAWEAGEPSLSNAQFVLRQGDLREQLLQLSGVEELQV